LNKYLQRILILSIAAFLLAAIIKVYQEECNHCRTQGNHNGFNHLLTAASYATGNNIKTLINVTHLSSINSLIFFNWSTFKVTQDKATKSKLL